MSEAIKQVFLNGAFVAEEKATISPLDRGFLFGDGVYEVIPAYNGKIFRLDAHLARLQHSLDAVHIANPYSTKEYQRIIEKLLDTTLIAQKIYLHISRGVGAVRNYQAETLTPTVYMRSDGFTPKAKEILHQGVGAALAEDMRWKNCFIKSTSLLAGVLYAFKIAEQGVEEMILHRDGIITEGASSNVFIVKNGVLYTPAVSNLILAGVTREVVLESAQMSNISTKEQDISIEELLSADEVWISSSTREIMPIKQIKNTVFPQREVWSQVYDNFQSIKNG